MKALVTGFAPYGGRDINPAARLAEAVDGTQLGALRVVGSRLPVDLQAAVSVLVALVELHRPDIVLCLGLWPGEAVIRLERIALNRADFEIPDASGRLPRNELLDPTGPDGLCATMPLHAIAHALREAGIPARLSGTAGTYLCNATFYALLNTARQRWPQMRGGFMHVPYLPEQVAKLMQDVESDRQLELHQRADLASMAFDTMLKAVHVTLVTASLQDSST